LAGCGVEAFVSGDQPLVGTQESLGLLLSTHRVPSIPDELVEILTGCLMPGGAGVQAGQRQHELAASAAYATLDLGDRDEAACAQMAKQEGDRRFAGQFRRLRPVLVDPGHVDVGDEVVGIGTLEHEHLEGVASLGSLDEGDQIADRVRVPEDSWAGLQCPRTERTLPHAR
jgi:hypothetical protein